MSFCSSQHAENLWARSPWTCHSHRQTFGRSLHGKKRGGVTAAGYLFRAYMGKSTSYEAIRAASTPYPLSLKSAC
jgi:hypothetical protein